MVVVAAAAVALPNTRHARHPLHCAAWRCAHSRRAAQSPGEVKEGAAYAQETRRTILTMNKLTKSTPTGKQLLKNVSLGIYLG